MSLPENSDLQVDDFVVATKNFGKVIERAVGQVRRVGDDLDVYFIWLDKTVNTQRDAVQKFDIEKTGKPKEGKLYEKKICNICHLLKDQATEFEPNQTDKDGRKTPRPSCNDCRIDINGKKLLNSEKKRMEKTKPKDKTIFTCPICLKRTIVGITVRVVLDHSARSGRARGWICDSCNTGLGRFKDEIQFLDRIREYLTGRG